jgi:dihydrofolate synthase / folylpolyglutamate synthase
MTLDEILSNYVNNEKAASSFYEYSLNGIRLLLEKFNNPQNSIRMVHVAGTNGKGSVCHMINDICRAHGLNTGLYTSPHLLRITERIMINNKEISQESLLSAIIRIHECALKNTITLTWFDVMTAAAFILFCEMNVDIAIIETGLGGALDSTNIITPVLSVITDISFDHMHVLGDTIEEIAENKAGIIKPSVPVVTSAENTALTVIKEKAATYNSEIYVLGQHFRNSRISPLRKGISFNYSSENMSLNDIYIAHPGFFQARNASLALYAAEILGTEKFFALNAQLVLNAFSHLEIPGRMQVLCEKPLIIFDPAHNSQSLNSLSEIIAQRYKDINVHLFITLMKDKHPEKMLQLITDKISADITYCTLDDRRAFIPDSAINMIDSSDIHAIVSEIKDENLSLFTGSFRLYNTAVAAARIAGHHISEESTDD